MDLLTREYHSIGSVSGPLLFLEGVREGRLGEMVEVYLPDGEVKIGQVLQLLEDTAVIQVLGGASGIDTKGSWVTLKGEVAKTGVSLDMLGRVFDGMGRPIDGLPPIIPDKWLDLMGLPINPSSRDKPSHFIQTGISAIDGLNTLVRGQKLPIFSGAGLPANEIALQIVRQAQTPHLSGGWGRGPQTPPMHRGGRTKEGGGAFSIVFGAMGITARESLFFRRGFEETGAMERTAAFINLADDPAIERLFTPRMALTLAEYLAFEKGHHVLVILTDMTNYCDALREIGSARDEIPSRRGYPGYMYTDLATIYERAGRIKGREGSITLLPILTMPEDDITHPIPDLTGYITEGQIVLSRPLHRKGIYPPIDVLPCLSRLMNLGIGEDKTRADHRGMADQLYAFYARGRDVRRLVAIVGEEGLSDVDKRYLKFADEFERRFVGQETSNRSIEETLNIGWELLSMMPRGEFTRVREEFVERYYSSSQ